MDITKFDPNAPAFGENVQRVDADGNIIEPEAKPVEPSVEVPAEEVKEKPEEAKEEVVEDSVEEENKVPYSRFKKFHDQAKEAEREAEYWRREAETLKSRQTQVENKDSDEDWKDWAEAYGDSDASKRLFERDKERRERLYEEAKEAAISAVKSDRLQEEERQERNEAEIDSRLERLSEYLGRPLTGKEEDAILDIIDEFTPTGEDGKYAGDLISEEKAWEIYEMKQARANAPKKESRDKVASITGSQTHGETNVSPDKNKDFNPSWGSVSESVKKYGL